MVKDDNYEVEKVQRVNYFSKEYLSNAINRNLWLQREKNDIFYQNGMVYMVNVYRVGEVTYCNDHSVILHLHKFCEQFKLFGQYSKWFTNSNSSIWIKLRFQSFIMIYYLHKEPKFILSCNLSSYRKDGCTTTTGRLDEKLPLH